MYYPLHPQKASHGKLSRRITPVFLALKLRVQMSSLLESTMPEGGKAHCILISRNN